MADDQPYWRIYITEEKDELVLKVDKFKIERFFEGETWDKIYIDKDRLFMSIITTKEEIVNNYISDKKKKIKEDIDNIIRLKSMKYSELLLSMNRNKVLEDLSNDINNEK